MKILRNYQSALSSLLIYKDILLPTVTPRRMTNAALMATEYLLGRSRVAAKPVGIKLEVANLCNLRCPGCLHGRDSRAEAFQSKRYMSEETFHRILAELAPDIFFMLLYHTGEPFLNKDLPKFFRLARERKIATVVSSHLSLLLKDNEIESIVANGLSYLTVSLDGATQETYEKYRVGGKIDLVLENVRRLIAVKRRLKSKTPIMAWQYIDFEHTRHEIEPAKAMARQLGFDQFVLMHQNELLCREPDTYIGSGNEQPHIPDQFPFKCRWLWALPIVLFDGEVVPCCHYDWNNKKHFGSVANRPFSEIWKGESYRTNRRLVTNKESCRDNPEAYCSKCPLKVPDF